MDLIVGLVERSDAALESLRSVFAAHQPPFLGRSILAWSTSFLRSFRILYHYDIWW